MFEAILPPPEFDRPYEGRLTIERMAPSELHQRCQGWRHGGTVQACAIPGAGHCVIVWPDDETRFPAKYLAAMWRHEIGHCHGWKHPSPLTTRGRQP